FTRAMARMVGDTGTVVAIDLQEEMLQIVEETARQEGLLPRIRLHQARPETLGCSRRECADFALAFYVVHEVPDPGRLLREISALLAPGGRLLLVEPKGEVPPAAFERTVQTSRAAGLRVVRRPRVLISRAVLLQKESAG
ncbi:MAG TPA: class I SAM-dependent methyltransferase, partial [Methanomicrobiales archaeon]|nr:class I SAM-dependent methyltransferase [Methanomicrobiales archaeon]